MSHKPARAVENAAVHIESRSTALKSFILASLISLIFALAAGAQTVAGTVVDATTGKPVADAVVALVNPSAKDTMFVTFRANALGRFVATAPRKGEYRLRASHNGYSMVFSEDIKLEPAEVTMMEIALPDSAAATSGTAGSMKILAKRTLSNAELMSPLGFDIRRARAVGSFVAQEELSKYGRLPFPNMLRDNASRLSLEFALDRVFMQDVIMMRQGASACLPEVRLDGSPLPAARGASLQRLDGYASNQIYGVEVYRPSQVPSPKLAGEIGTAAPDCGVVAIWTNAQRIQTAQQLWSGGSRR